MRLNDVVVSNLNSAYVRSQDICELQIRFLGHPHSILEPEHSNTHTRIAVSDKTWWNSVFTEIISLNLDSRTPASLYNNFRVICTEPVLLLSSVRLDKTWPPIMLSITSVMDIMILF
jgi:hypothetical protein